MNDNAPCASGEIMILFRYYKVTDRRQVINRHRPVQTRLELRVDWLCINDLAAKPSVLPATPQLELVARISVKAQGLGDWAKSAHDPGNLRELLARVREATTESLADRIDEKLVGKTLDVQVWDPSGHFPLASAAEIITNVSDQVNIAVSAGIQKAAIGQGVPGPLADIGSSIATNILVGPIEQPIRKGTEIIELAGLVIGILTCQPQLVLACTKVLAHDAINTLISETISEAVSTIARMGTATSSHTIMRSAGSRTPISEKSAREIREALDDAITRAQQLGQPTRANNPAEVKRIIGPTDPLGSVT